MGSEKHIKIHNKSDKPDNVVLNEHDLVSRCEDLEKTAAVVSQGLFRLLEGKCAAQDQAFISARYQILLSISDRAD